MTASSQYYSVTARVGVPHRHEVAVTVPLVGPAGATGPAGAAGASAWNDITGKPSTFAPSAHASTHHTTGSDPLTPANIGAAKDFTEIEVGNSGTSTTTLTTAQLPARVILFLDASGEVSATINLPTPDARQSGLSASIKVQRETGTTDSALITVVHSGTTLLYTELAEAEGSITFVWDGYEWSYSNKFFFANFAGRNLLLPASSGTLARTEDFASPPAIGNTTPAAGTFTTLSANNGTLTASAPVLDLSQTWNNAAVAFTALRVNVTNTNSLASSKLLDVQSGGSSDFSVYGSRRVTLGAFSPTFFGPSLELSSGTGFYDSGGLRVTVAGTNSLIFTNAGMKVRGGTLGFQSGDETVLVSDGNDILAMRRGAVANTFRLYTTYGGTTSFERLSLRGQTTNNFIIATEKGTTGGAARGLELRTDSVTRMTLGDAGGVTIADANNIAVGTTTGTKIGTATNQKIGFFDKTPVVQQAAIADATDAATTQARLNDLLATMRTFGLIAT